MLIYKRNVHRKIRTLSQLGAEKIAFLPKPNIWTDISNYRIALLLKNVTETSFAKKATKTTM